MAGDGRAALVTGASRGLGAALAVELAQRGWTVFAGSRSATLPGGSGDLRPLSLDVTRDDSVERAFAEILAARQPLELVINNAGINFSGPFEEVALGQGADVLQTNLLGVARVTRAALAHMRPRRRGTILTVGSLAGRVAPPGESYYAASKFALEGLLESLHHELLAFNIRILLAEPGYIHTDFANAERDSAATIADYDRTRGILHDHWRRSIRSGMDAQQVARKMVDWAERPGSAMRRRFGWQAHWVTAARRWVPESLFLYTTRWVFGIASAKMPEPAR